LDVNNHAVQADFFDMDNDGDLDLWVNSHARIRDVRRIIKENGFDQPGSGNQIENLNSLRTPELARSRIKVFKNDGGKYVNYSMFSGTDMIAYGLGLSVGDINEDGYLDVYVANDYAFPDYYFLNRKGNGFKNTWDYLNHTSYFSMGSDLNDYNNDGILDLVVVDMTPSDHYRNKTLMESMNVASFYTLTERYKLPRAYMFNSFQVGVGGGHLSEIANALGSALTDWSWAPLLFDMNNDGRKDLYITNGYLRDSKNQDYRYRQDSIIRAMGDQYTSEVAFNELQKIPSTPVQNVAYENFGEFQLENVSSNFSGQTPTFSNGAAYGDLDNDGDLDLVINNLNSPAGLFRNDSKANYLVVKFKEPTKAQHKNARIELYTEDGMQRADYSFTRGYLSTMEQKIHFGLGDLKMVDSLAVYWLNGTSTIVRDIEANQVITVEPTLRKKQTAVANDGPTLFRDMSQYMVGPQTVHHEAFHNDFAKEVLLPQKYSSLGPALAPVDLDGNGEALGFYLGGSQGYPGKILRMGKRGLTNVAEGTFAKDADYEDLGAHFFDADGDGKPDLYVASGGGSEVEGRLLQDRLYLNKEDNNFSRNNLALPKMSSSTKAISSFDFDKDGDLDLFVGGRNNPGKYPSKAESYLLINDGGVFSKAPLDNFYQSLPNMVSSSKVLDINEDGWMDLIVVGEWSAPEIYLNEKGKDLVRRSYPELESLKGWWYSVASGDFNNDGKEDFVLGNLGVNNKFHASPKKPLQVFFNDFDENGSQDIFLAKNYKDKIVPVRGKECSSEQMPMLLDKFKSYDAFASASIEEVLGENMIESGGQLEVTTFESVVLINKGNGFEIKTLPFPAQWAPILDFELLDLNKDGNLDIVGVGNIFNTEPETPSYDAGKGVVLFGDGKGDFTCEFNLNKTGFNVNRNAKEIALLGRPGGHALIIGNNNSSLQLFLLNP
ncbi:MAG: VCBS repeat-containing protein, partial [Saprospiraceae bacterium]|nr:VCBS repeat-containing protein [Saprospiraceae bacterium]